MKKSISILFCLFMFPLFLNTSQVNAQVVTNIEHCEQLEPTAARPACEAAAHGQPPIQGESPISAETVSTPDQSDDPRNIMNSESVDFNKETLQLHKRIAELEGLLSEANAMSSNIEGKLANMVKPELYDDAVRLLKEANAKISDLENKLAKADELYDDAVRLYKDQKAQLSKANENFEQAGILYTEKAEQVGAYVSRIAELEDAQKIQQGDQEEKNRLQSEVNQLNGKIRTLCRMKPMGGTSVSLHRCHCEGMQNHC